MQLMEVLLIKSELTRNMATDVTVEYANGAVDTIVRALHDTDSSGTFTLTETIKAGSLGHGTAVQGHYDLDLVIYSDSVDGQKVARDGFEQYLRIIERHLEKKLQGRIQERQTNAYSLQFKFDGYIDVDALISPFWREPRLFYQFLQGIAPAKRSMFSVSASKWQVAFFKDQPNQVKELVKRAKAWRNQAWSSDPTGKPKSYLIAVLIVCAFERARLTTGGDLTFPRLPLQVTKVMKEIVENHETADIYWEQYYRKYDYRDLFPRSCPRIVDPANPANNLHESGIAGRSNKKAQDYQDGGGSWAPFVHCVRSLDLTKTVEELS